jgi:hypothetical protein
MRVLFVLPVCLLGCSDPTPTAADAAHDLALADAVARDAPAGDVVAVDATEAFCARDPRVQGPAAGVEQRGMTVVARRESMAPAGSGRGLYTWTVALRTDAGPLPVDATLAASPRMPDHGHGARRAPTVRSLGGGRFEIAGLDLYMEGVWTITLRISTNGATDQVVFGVCIG